jgi:hypothetical protein
MATIETKVEGKRGCGYRKPGALYFISEGIASSCDKLPILLDVCPCCSAGIKQARGFTWILSKLFEDKNCNGNCERCPMNLKDLRLGLMWVGEKYYPTPAHFSKEAARMGVSKRISQIPKEFIVGETWIALAHPKAISEVNAETEEIEYKPGIFRAFQPDRIEYVVRGDESEEDLASKEKRGITLVKVIPEVEQNELY